MKPPMICAPFQGSRYGRALVIGSGPAMNIMLAFLLAAIVLSSVGYTTNRVSYLGENSPLKDAGMEVGGQTHLLC